MPGLMNQNADPFAAFTKALEAGSAPADAFGRSIDDLTVKLNQIQPPTDAFGRSIDSLSNKIRQAAAGYNQAAEKTGGLTATIKTIFDGIAAGARMASNAAGGAFKTIASASMIPLAGAANVFAVAAGAAVQQISRFVEKANPATAFQFNRALDDLAGTMGKILAPILEGITIFIRAFADGLTGLMPALDPIMQGFKQIFEAIVPLMQVLMEAMGPTFQLIGNLLQSIVVPAIKLLAEVLTTIAKVIMKVIETISFGLISFDESKAKSSVGAAIRPAAYGKIEDIGKRTTLDALNKTDRGNQIANKIDTSNNWLSKIFDKIGGKSTSEMIGNNWGGRAVKGFDQVGRWISKQWRDL